MPFCIQYLNDNPFTQYRDEGYINHIKIRGAKGSYTTLINNIDALTICKFSTVIMRWMEGPSKETCEQLYRNIVHIKGARRWLEQNMTRLLKVITASNSTKAQKKFEVRLWSKESQTWMRATLYFIREYLDGWQEWAWRNWTIWRSHCGGAYVSFKLARGGVDGRI